jgi:3-isopropylmalate dehydratase small subunit
LPEEKIKELADFSKNKKEIEVNLDQQKITKGDNQPIEFDVDPFQKECLMNGLDDIGITLKKSESITKFISNQKNKTPWLF